DRIHETAIVVFTLLEHAPLQDGHSVGIVGGGDGKRDARVTPHVLGFQLSAARTDEDAVTFQPDPDDPVARRAVPPQRRQVDEVRCVEKLAYIKRDRLHPRQYPGVVRALRASGRDVEIDPERPGRVLLGFERNGRMLVTRVARAQYGSALTCRKSSG